MDKLARTEKLKSLIRDHTKAQVELSWLGSGDPEFFDSISHNAKIAKMKLMVFIKELSD
ncbi:MAG: hypothetical protein ACYSW3_24605 [Planctomycetota bacterium]|jgi:hypothetical protein